VQGGQLELADTAEGADPPRGGYDRAAGDARRPRLTLSPEWRGADAPGVRSQDENGAFSTLAPDPPLDLMHQHEPFDPAADGREDRIGHLRHVGARFRLRFRA
jgi:hypothetical protein